ncbi:hypothetical protein HY212_05475 [Candidatus Pacearchaeota archaeon]|nr:hypothetical protein [Candidatus Pacearchaeota archaeon]
MSRIKFDSSGKIEAIDGKLVEFEQASEIEDEEHSQVKLRTSDSLEFLKEEASPPMENIFERENWSLKSASIDLKPLKFSNGKTQEDVVKEIVSLINGGNKVIFLYGTCGTGKSAIALNIARVLGKASIVVPVKALQRQYEEDYMSRMSVIKKNGRKMKIAMLTGRENHDSIFYPGKSCADPSLPENIKITEKNYGQLLEYYRNNPFVNNKGDLDLEDIRRLSVAPANPYWSPILPADFELNILKDAEKKKYKGLNGREYVFYHRKKGCSYYDQYLAYLSADVIIFNSAKYLSEHALGRKPQTEIEIIDEADDFLDSLFQQQELNITRFGAALKSLIVQTLKAQQGKDKILELLELEERNKKALGVDSSVIFSINETKLRQILEILASNLELESEISLDDINYSNKALEASRIFKNSLDDVYLTYRKEEDNLFVSLVSTNLSGKLKDIIDNNKALVFMSGTIHSSQVLRNIFKIKDFKIVEAETFNLGSVEIIKTGKEIDCKYSNFTSKNHTKEEYLKALSASMAKSVKPTLVHVHAFQDLPSENEKSSLELNNLVSFEQLYRIQKEDKSGKNISLFKEGMSDVLFSTKCSRGVDFPGNICRSIIFTKYPNPNISDIFWKVLKMKHQDYFWDFYKDKARREFLQRIYRAVRSHDDHVYILSPDIRVLDAVRELQVNGKIG